LAAGFSVLFVVGVAACSSSPNNGGSSATTASTAKPSQDVAADKAAAQAASLVLTDFPAGWTAQANSNTSTDVQNSKSELTQLAKCLGVSETELADAPASYSSPDFSENTTERTASSTVNYRATSAEQNRAFELLTSPKTPGCLATTFKNVIDEAIKHPSSPEETLPAGANIGQPTVSRISFPAVGDKSAALQVRIPVSYQGLSITPVLDGVFVIKGRAGVDMSFQSFQTPFPIDQQKHYTQLVVNRLTNT
jgi:hypothetical protein